MSDINIKNALEMAYAGSFDGGHHKMWVIDQMVRALCGCPKTEEGNISAYGLNEAYLTWVREFEQGEDGPKTYHWDEGIAP